MYLELLLKNDDGSLVYSTHLPISSQAPFLNWWPDPPIYTEHFTLYSISLSTNAGPPKSGKFSAAGESLLARLGELITKSGV
jgi:hypothetical protein